MEDRSSSAVLDGPPPAAVPQKPAWKKLRRSTRICLLLTRLLILTILLELGSRVYWLIAKGVPAFHTSQIVHSFFPELKEGKLDEAPRDQKDGTLDVLVLGPSVWYWVYGDVAPRFEKQLAEKLGRPVRVFNASHSGNTTRDALLVYKMLGEQRFDLVVVYHGINDVFLNNCPSEIFRSDYTHAPRFEQLRLLDAHREHSWFALPYTVRYLRSRIGEKLHIDPRPTREQAAQYGTHLMTPPAVHANLQEIIDLARTRNAQVLLLTNAWHLPSDYTEEAFAAKTLDYDRHIHRLATWGTPESVSAGMRAHNEVIRTLAHENKDVLFADMEKLMPGGKLYYDDVCHFNPKGCEAFVDLLIKNGEWSKLR
ncbi:MAG: SGNH/GDSL hydrolase family protein [Gemmataceae bacterium]